MIFKKLSNYILYLMAFFVLIGCAEENEIDINSMYKVYDNESKDIPEVLKSISEKSIYFGHQSVGKNIISGIDYWVKETNIQLNIIESRDFSEITSPAFIHFRIGENRNPVLKIDDFSNMIYEIRSDINSIVFLKFCYVDITKETSINSIFSHYKKSMILLKKHNPDLNLVVFTVPLKTVRRGVKEFIRKLLYGKDINIENNKKRDEFNKRIIAELGKEFPVFDLARVEATLPDGKINTYKYKGNHYPALCSSYTTDGGHLNETGAQIVAYNLLSFLSELSEN